MSILLDSIFLTHTSKGVRAEMCEASWWLGALRGTDTARDNDIGRGECRALAARAVEAFEAQHGGARPAAKTTKKRVTHTDETTIIEPDPEDDPEEDPDDDDDDQDDDAARTEVAASLGGIAAEIEAVANKAGLSGTDRADFVAAALRDQASVGSGPPRLPSAQMERVADAFHLTGDERKAFLASAVRDQSATARPSLASTPAARPSMSIRMTSDDMAQPKPPKRAGAVHRSPSPNVPPPIVGGPWRERP